MSVERLRFKDYDDKISKIHINKLSEVLESGSKKPVTDKSRFKRITVKLHFKGVVNSDSSIQLKDTRPFYQRFKDEIIIGKQNYFNGSVAIVPEKFDGSICSNAIMSFKAKNIDTNYLFYQISRPDFLKKREMLANGTGQKELSEKDFLNFKIKVPSKLEQEKIGNFLSLFDRLIEKLETKMGLLKELKKGYLQQMFPTKGEKVPKIRFAAFDEEWCINRLEQLTTIKMGQSPKGVNYSSNPNDYILVQGNADIKNRKVKPRVWTTQITKLANKNDLILTVRAPVGAVGKTDYDVVIGRGVASIKGNDFIYQDLLRRELNGFWSTFSTGSTFDSINSAVLKNTLIKIPSKKEQEKIGDFFKSLDSMIEKHAKEMNVIEQLKKGYMQRLFA